MPHAVKMFKQMFLHTDNLTKMLTIIILKVIPSIHKSVSCFPTILFSTTPGQKINEAVIVTVEFVIYFICPASSIVSKCARFRDIHTYFTPFVDPTTLSNGYNLALTR